MLQFDELRIWREHGGRYEIESADDKFIARTAKGATMENRFKESFWTLGDAKQACEKHFAKFNCECDDPVDARLGT